MANLVVMPGRDVESKAADNNPVIAASRRALTLAQDVGMSRVLVIYKPNDGRKLGVIDSGMTIAEAFHMAEVFKFWMLRESVAARPATKERHENGPQPHVFFVMAASRSD